MVPKVALTLSQATCFATTSKDLEGLSREPCVHGCVGRWGVSSEQRAFQGHGPGVQRKSLGESTDGGEIFCSVEPSG